MSTPPLRELRPQDLDVVLPCLLAEPGATRARPAQVEGFRHYLADGGLDWAGWCAGDPAAPLALCVALLVPGRTAMLMIPPASALLGPPEEQIALTKAALAALGERRLHYAQALLEPGAAEQAGVLQAVGFTELAPLVYLDRSVRFPWCEPPQDTAVAWETYTPAQRARFAEVVGRTYAGSRDCPELAGLRPMEDVLTAHAASGTFVPKLWGLARRGAEDLGCILLAQLAGGAAVEIVYLGVVPEARGQGYGKLLLRWAFAQARRVGAAQITVVVDERNAAACRLYEGFSFRELARREAWLYCWTTRPV